MGSGGVGGGLQALKRTSAGFSDHPYAPLVLILLVAAALRFIGIGQQSFSIDEISELRIAHTDITDIVTFDDGFPPLYHLLLHFVLPLGDLSGRILSVFFGVATVGITWVWARRIAGGRVGFYAALLVAICPIAVDFSREGRAYGLMGLLVAASLWALWAALDDPSTLRWVRWGGLSVLGIYTHYLFVVLIAASVIVALVEVRGRSLRGMLIGIGVLTVLAAPVLAILPGDATLQVSASGAGLRLGELLYAGYVVLAGFFLGPPERDLHYLGLGGAIRAGWVWMVLLVPVFGVLSVQGWRAASRPTRRRVLAFAIPGIVLGGVMMFATNAVIGPRYVLWLVVPLALWFGMGLARLRRYWRWASVAVLLVVAVSAAVARSVDPHRHVEDARGVAAYLEASGALDHPVLVSGMYRARTIVYYIDRPLALALPDQWDPETGRLGYYPDEQLRLISIPPLDSEGFGLSDALALVDAHTELGGPYDLVYSQAFHNDPQGELLLALSTRDGLSLVESFVGFDVYRGVRSGY